MKTDHENRCRCNRAAGSSPAAQAQSLIFGAGYADFSSSRSDDQAVISLEYQHNPFYDADRFDATWGVAATVDEAGDFHLGVGPVGIYTFANRWFVEGSVMPGYYSEGDDDNDLGGGFQIRSLLGVGYTLNSSNKISLAVTHISNASTQDDNPASMLRFCGFTSRSDLICPTGIDF